MQGSRGGEEQDSALLQVEEAWEDHVFSDADTQEPHIFSHRPEPYMMKCRHCNRRYFAQKEDTEKQQLAVTRWRRFILRMRLRQQWARVGLVLRLMKQIHRG